jgi:hypothetical protein
MSTPDYPPRSTPLHEAGHSVVARALGARRVKASIIPGAVGESPLASGHCAYDFPYMPTDLEQLRAELTISVAGHAAEMIAAGRSLEGPAHPREISQRIMAREGLPRPNARSDALKQLTRMYGGDELTGYRALDAISADILRRAVEILKRNLARG